jgi:hypothetical protein
MRMRLGDRDFPIDPRALESGSISWAEGGAAAGCPARALRRVEELEAAAALQGALAAEPESSARWCKVSTGTVDVAGREVFYVLSELPEGARPLAALLEAEAAHAATMTEFRRATLAWSLAVGVLRALADIHDRGIHHGELSAESALRDRIVVRARDDGTLDVLLQFPSPRLARLLQEERQSEVATSDQTDVARLAHILRAVLHGRDVLDPDTNVDALLLSRLFGGNDASWARFFESCARGALHGDPAFVRAQLALLEPAKPAEESSAAARDLKFRLARLFAQPLVRIGSVAAGVTIVMLVVLMLMWNRLFPPVQWNVALADADLANSLTEGDEIRVSVTTGSERDDAENSEPPPDPGEVVALCYRDGDLEPFARLVFEPRSDLQGARTWRFESLPDADRPYEVRFELAGSNVVGGAIRVGAEDAKPSYQIEGSSRTSDDDGVFRLQLTGVDVDSGLVAEPSVSVDGVAAKLRPARDQPAPADDAAPLEARQAWVAEVDLGHLQAVNDRRNIEIRVGDETRRERATLRSIPFEVARVAAADGNPEEGARVTLRLAPKSGRTIGSRERVAVIQFSRTDLPDQTVPFKDGKATIELPEADGEYRVKVAVSGVKGVDLGFSVVADDDAPNYTLKAGDALPLQTRGSSTIRVPVQIAADDIDTESTAIAQPQILDGSTPVPLVDVRVEQPGARDAVRGTRIWSGFVELTRGQVDRRAELSLRPGGGVGQRIAAAKQVLVPALPKPEPVIVAAQEPKRDSPVGRADPVKGSKTGETKGETAVARGEEANKPSPIDPKDTESAGKETAKNDSTQTETTKTETTKTETKSEAAPAGTTDAKTATASEQKSEPVKIKEPEPVVVAPPPPPPPPPPRPGPPLARVSSPTVSENGTVEVSAYAENPELPLDARALAATAWRLIDAPPPLKTAIATQVDAINRNPTRAGTLRAPEHDENYEIRLELKSSDPEFPQPSRIAIAVVAPNNPSQIADALVDTKGQVLRSRSEVGDAANTVTDGIVKLELRVVDPDSAIEPPAVLVNGEAWPDLVEQTDANPRPVDEKRFVGEIRIAGGANSSISVNGKTYVIRWDPANPRDAAITWVQFTPLGQDSWLSDPIGVAAGQFDSGSDASPLERAQLAQLLESFAGTGFDARLASVEEITAVMKSRPRPPELAEVLHGLIGASSIGKLRKGATNPEVIWINTALRDQLPTKRSGNGDTPNWDAIPVTLPGAIDRAVQATYCGDSASPQVVGLPGGPMNLPEKMSNLDKSKRLKDLLGAVWSDGAWNPRPLPADAPVKSAYARVVLVKQKTSD